MKTSSRIFATLLLSLGSFAAGAAALCGAKHQWFIVGLCLTVAIALLIDAGKKIDKVSKYSRF